MKKDHVIQYARIYSEMLRLQPLDITLNVHFDVLYRLIRLQEDYIFEEVI